MMEVFEQLPGENAKHYAKRALLYNLVNLEELYPDNPNVKKYGFYLKDTKFAEKIGYSGIVDDDVYIGIRKPADTTWASQKDMQKVYDESIIVLDRIIKDLT